MCGLIEDKRLHTQEVYIAVEQVVLDLISRLTAFDRAETFAEIVL
jgi:hypothetical protein